MYDIAVVGAGFSGLTLAERFSSIGRKVIVVESRDHIGGNAYDSYDEHGILIHNYGAHIFHTNDEKVFRYLSNFTQWREYIHRTAAYVDGKLVPFPINAKSLEILYGKEALKEGVQAFLEKVKVPISQPKNAEENIVSRMGWDIYNKFFRGYTEKQWGRKASELSPMVTDRIPIRYDSDDRYFSDKFQVMPKYGYNSLFRNMVKKGGFPVVLNADWHKLDLDYEKLIYTGPIDRYFEFKYGKLPYRSIEFKYTFHKMDQYQPVASIKYSNDYKYTRRIEFKYITGQEHPHTVTSVEYPRSSGDPFYPIPAEDAQNLYRKYKAEAEKLDNVRFVGRLATYRYYNMDQVVASALKEFSNLVEQGW